MKITKIQKTSIILLILLLGGMHVSQAQFWKKIKEVAKDAAEETVLRKTEEKASEKTENAIDSIFEIPKNRKRKNGENRDYDDNSSDDESYDNSEDQEDAKLHQDSEAETMEVDENILEAYLGQEEEVKLAASYSFDWKYVIQMESEAYKKKKDMGDMKVTYLLNPESTAFATQFDMGNTKMDLGNTIMVMDPIAGVNFTLMEVEGQKIIQKMPSMANIMKDNEEADDTMDNITIKKIGTKDILGFTCQGFEIRLEEGTSIVYMNPNAPVSFNHSGNPKFAPKGFKQEWLEEFKNGLMMEMTFTSNKKPKHNMKMTCVELVEEPFTVQLSEYKSFMEMGQEK